MRPKTQKRMPKSSSLWPSMPRNWTCDKSGNLRLASPAASSLAWARAAMSSVAAAAAAPNFVIRHAKDQALVSQARIKTAPVRETDAGKTRQGDRQAATTRNHLLRQTTPAKQDTD